MNGRQQPWVRLRGLVVVHRLRRDHADHTVFENRETDRNTERNPLLVQGDDPHDNEEVEMHLDQAAREVNEHCRAEDQTERRDAGAEPTWQRRPRSSRRRQDDRLEINEGVRRGVMGHHADDEQDGDVGPEQEHDPAASGLPDVHRERPAGRQEPCEAPVRRLKRANTEVHGTCPVQLSGVRSPGRLADGPDEGPASRLGH